MSKEEKKPVLIEEMSIGKLYKAHYSALAELNSLQQQAQELSNQIIAIGQEIEKKAPLEPIEKKD